MENLFAKKIFNNDQNLKLRKKDDLIKLGEKIDNIVDCVQKRKRVFNRLYYHYANVCHIDKTDHLLVLLICKMTLVIDSRMLIAN